MRSTRFFASILLHRILSAVDHHLQRTQFGFRKHHSTTMAIHVIRRLMDYSEVTGLESVYLFLYWEKAFDKVTHPALIHTLRRAKFPSKFTNIIQTIYSQPEFSCTIMIASLAHLHNIQAFVKGAHFRLIYFLLSCMYLMVWCNSSAIML